MSSLPFRAGFHHRIIYSLIMKVLSCFLIVLSSLLVIAAPVSAERGYGLMFFLLCTGFIGIAGGIGVWRKKRWGMYLALIANIMILVPMIFLFQMLVKDTVASGALLDNGSCYLFLAALVPVAVVLILLRNRTKFS